MKRCPECRRDYYDDSLLYCLDDGSALLDGLASADEPATAILHAAELAHESPTKVQINTADQHAIVPSGSLPSDQSRSTSSAEYLVGKARSHKRSLAIGLAILLFAASGLGYWFFKIHLATSDSAPINSIAVLPFDNKSGNADSDYLSDGLTESLIYKLSQLPNLKVSPRSSVFRYKGKDIDAETVGAELGVDAVMSGRLVQRGESITISIDLVDVRNKKTLWGEQYERKMSDLLATQREIAAEITKKLELKLSGDDRKGLTKGYTENNEAYQLYLKGRYHFAKRTKNDVQKGLDYFEQAIRLDPNFALAYVGIADIYNSMPLFGYMSPKEAIPLAQRAAMHAVQIDPALADGHAALAMSITTSDWDWVKAQQEFTLALQLDPNNAGTHYRYAESFLLPAGRTDEAITELKQAMELEPLDLLLGANLAGAYMYAGQNELAVEQGKKTFDLDPNFVGGRIWLALIYNANGRYDDALALCEKPLQNFPSDQFCLAISGYANAKLGRRPDAEEIIKKYREVAKTQYISHYWIGVIFAALGQRDEAFAELEKAFDDRDLFILRLKIDPLMVSLHEDPRFKNMVRRIGLPE